MLIPGDLSENERAIRSAEIICQSPLSEAKGLKDLTLSKYYPRGSILFVEGQRPCGVFVLCEGRAKVSIASADGKTLVLRIAQAGELLGMNAALTGQPFGATVETIERCRIEFIAREDLWTLLERDKTACLGVARALSFKLSSVVDHTRLLFLSQSAPEKLARLFIGWCDEHGKRTARGIRIGSGLTHEEMAQMICASRETVTRMLGDFKRKKIVTFADNAIFVRNRRALEAVARC